MTALQQIPHGVLVAAENDATVSVAERHEFAPDVIPASARSPSESYTLPCSSIPNRGENCGALPVQEQHMVWDHEHGIG
ncbi:hypothetical protein ACFV0Y_18935 [Streptomyces sp. NPDC059569]|uniref:hypothetical protein n=1 Tax=Streptomyces sp. NPDC059569 TaxID=3346869 RepID=UPI0036C9C2FF